MLYQSWSRVGSIHGSGQVGSGWVTQFFALSGSGPKLFNKYTICTQETDYSTTTIHNDKKL